MIVSIGRIETFPADVLVESDLGPRRPDYDSLISVGVARAELNIQKAGEEYFCQGRVTVSMSVECARCLTAFDQQMESQLDFIVCDKEHYRLTRSEAVDDEDYLFFCDGDMNVDIAPAVIQAVVLSVSMKPLCSESCRGLCSRCGTNLNEKQCNCVSKTADPRWDGLKKLSINQR